MKNLSIGKKLSLTFGLVLVLYVGALFIALFFGMRIVGNSFSGFYSGPHEVIYTAMDLRRSTQVIEKGLLKLATAENSADLTEYQNEIEQAANDFNTDITFLKQNLTLDENIKKADEILAKQGSLKAARQEFLQYIQQGDSNKALAIYNSQYAPLADEVRDLAIAISNTTKTVGDDYYSHAKSTELRVTLAVILYFLVSMAIAAILCVYIIRSITRPIREIEAAAKLLADGKLNADVNYSSKDELGSLANSIHILIKKLSSYIYDIERVLQRISDGDLTVSIDINYQNDFAPIKQSMEKIITSLNTTLSQISTSSQQVAVGSEQMSSGAQELAQGATEQAGSAEELAVSVAEVSEKVQGNANHSQQARNDMKETISEIRQGDEQMKKLVSAMDEIANSSGKIEKIIKTIEDIAFQTNILALNAAVEAARAGSAGKGFAVVADEVRNLANKSASAAKDTSGLIQSAIETIKNGDVMVAEVETYLNQIALKAEGVASLVDEIAESSEYQANYIEQINTNVNQISSVIQTNSATAEESAAASEELSAQAEMLNALVSHFKLQSEFDSNLNQ
ncbi:methyl-accepting chemotaxis protein [Aminipila butyrica]|uniref:Methyl-accepting chemotaxis protein n=1 Tax=Aminipila butyrica TaxID=433296 RepID=A0A858BT98_9FIRM|nr:methyl-accepting chemotaxis protein [Aminipila butyrica]QIB67994.1 methyl-accepting chemotaxis protein [Aminipila butyrica]